MIFGILFTITTVLVTLYVAPYDIAMAIFQFFALTMADCIIVGILSLFLSEFFIKEKSSFYVITKVNETSLMYWEGPGVQVGIRRSSIEQGANVEPDGIEYYEIIDYEHTPGFCFWLWDIVGYEPRFIEHLRPCRY